MRPAGAAGIIGRGCEADPPGPLHERPVALPATCGWPAMLHLQVLELSYKQRLHLSLPAPLTTPDEAYRRVQA